MVTRVPALPRAPRPTPSHGSTAARAAAETRAPGRAAPPRAPPAPLAGFAGAAQLLCYVLRQLAAAAGEALPDKETYYDADRGGWDMDGMASDMEQAKTEAAAAAVA